MKIWDVIKEILNSIEVSPKKIASDIGRNIATIYRWAKDPESGGSPIPGDLIVNFCQRVGDYRLIKHLANMCGFFLVPIPHMKREKRTGLVIQTIRIISDFSMMMSDVTKFLMCEKANANEMARLRREIHCMVERMLSFIQVLEKKAAR